MRLVRWRVTPLLLMAVVAGCGSGSSPAGGGKVPEVKEAEDLPPLPVDRY
ncbi:hypothetical protein [Streptomyces sp. NBRC 110028]|nr:hypothetical protein [Streptomyces sp. NBRC 110028]